jgi:hypothetical protein
VADPQVGTALAQLLRGEGEVVVLHQDGGAGAASSATAAANASSYRW